ncbi:MAG: hypothetical protein MJ211_12035 [Bacteroidales bacterium]|nr:hypothetical protein [Bacteroidales bacterium]
MSILSQINKIFTISKEQSQINNHQITGLFVGGAVGEALGLPVVDKTPEQLQKNPVTELLGFGDYQTPSGTFSMCTEASLEFANFLLDNSMQLITSKRLFALCNSWYLYKIKDEEFRLRKLLPISLVAGVVYSKLKQLSMDQIIELLPDLVCDSAIASASVFFNISKNISFGNSLEDSLKKSKNKTAKLCKDIGLIINNTNISLKLIDNVSECLINEDNYEKITLKSVNLGFYPDLSGFLTGSLSGLKYTYENIPIFWKNSISNIDKIKTISDKIFELPPEEIIM